MEFAGHPLVGTSWFLNVFRGRPCSEIVCGIGTIGTGVLDGRTWIGTRLDQAVDINDLGFAADAGMAGAIGGWTVALAPALRSGGEERGHLEILQGDEIGSPSSIDLSRSDHEVRVGGLVVHQESREID